jgi:hypothetical protein
MFFPSVVSAVVAGHVEGAADALAKSWKLQHEWGATPLGKTWPLSHPSSPFGATWKGVETAWSVSWFQGSSGEPKTDYRTAGRRDWIKRR